MSDKPECVGAVFGVSDTFLKVTWNLVVRSTPTEFQLRLWPIFPNSTKTIKSNWLLLLSYFGPLSNENQFEITCRIFLPHPLIYLSRSRRPEDRCIIHSTLAVVVFLTSEGRLSVKKKENVRHSNFQIGKMGFLTKTLQHHDHTEVWNEQKCPELSRVRSCISINDRWTCELNWNWMMSCFLFVM